jgi:protein TonB
MLFKTRFWLGNAIVISIILHTGIFALITGAVQLNFWGSRETLIETVPESALGNADDLSLESAIPESDRFEKTMEPGNGNLNESNTVNKQMTGNNMEGNNYGEGGSGETNTAVMISGSLPEYPAEAREKGLEGKLTLRLEISENGNVSDVVVLEKSGNSSFDEAAEKAVMKWRFQPAIKNGSAATSVFDVRVKFRLDN